MPMLLSPRREAFARRRITALDEPASASYRVLYPRARKASSWAAARRLLRNGNVAQRIEALRQLAAMRSDRAIDAIGEELDRAHELAMQRGQAAAAVAASMGKAKLYGLIVNKNESVRHDNNSS